jgi:predicted  nucleic acid-binding Zn-ribbon protein
MMIDRIQARRDALAAQMAEAQQQYEQLEQTLKLLDRQLCAMAGGLQELDALLEQEQQTTEPSCEGA